MSNYFWRIREKIICQNKVSKELSLVSFDKATALLNNAVALPLKKLEIKGQAKQAQYEGYNALQPINQSGYYNSIHVYQKFDDSYFSFNGTPTQSATYNAIEVDISYLGAGDYTFRAEGTVSGAAVITRIWTKSGTFVKNLGTINSSTNTSVVTFTLTESDIADGRVIKIAVSVTKDAYVEGIIQYDIVKGTYTSTTIPAYEPYVGGVPSPSPNYPQEIVGTIANIKLGDDIVNTNIELLGLGGYSEVLKLNRANRTLKKQSCIRKYTFTGEETFINISQDGLNGYYAEIEPIKIDDTPILCTHFYSEIRENVPCVEINKGVISFYYTPFATAEELKDFLKENTVEILYISEEGMKETDYSNESIAKELLNLVPIHNQDTLLEILGEAAPSEIFVAYFKNIEEDI